jgi:sugar-phosphatase
VQVEHGKPHPECFIKAAELLGVAASECVVIEDAASGAEVGIMDA